MKKLLTVLFLIPVFAHAQFVVRLSGKVAGFKTVPFTVYIGDTSLKIISTITLSPNVTFDAGGGWYIGTGDAFKSPGGALSDSVMNLWSNTADAIFDGSGNIITYNGTPQSALYYGLYTKNIHISGKTMLFSGTWEPARTLHNVVVGLNSVGTVVVNDTANSGNEKIWGNNLYQVIADGWNITGSTKPNLVDNGVIQIEEGNGVFKNGYRNGKMAGYIMRILGQAKLIGISGNQDSYVQNTVDANTIRYGTIDGRVDTSRLIPGYTTGGDIYFVHNNSCNKADIWYTTNFGSSYVTNACVVGAMYGFTFHIDSCIAFGAQFRADGMQAGSSLVKDNSSGSGKIVMHSDIDYVPPTMPPPGIVDSNFYSLLPNIGAHAPVAIAINPCAICPVNHGPVLYFTTEDGINFQYHFFDGYVQ
jgi:hypothetical protein